MAQEYGTLKYVTYNAGEDADGKVDEKVGIVTQDMGGGNLRLFVLDEGGGYFEDKNGEGVPHREPEDYGDEGGGVTWYYPRD